MKKVLIALALLATWPVTANVVNVEFKFTPFTGDLKEDHVQTVPGKARVFLNNVLFAEQDVGRQTVPVIFDDREIAPSVWVPMNSAGPILRKGRNSLRIEFLPSDASAAYRAQLSWASVTDQTTESQDASGASVSTNQSGEGMELKDGAGKIVLEREFAADFATDRPWHHYAAVSSLSDADRQQIAAAVAARAAGFKPGFADSYRMLEGQENFDLAAIRKSRCLDSAYAVGIRVRAPAPEQIEYSLTGNPEVVVGRRDGALFDTGTPELFARIKGDDNQMCAGMIIAVTYPPRLSFVRTPEGTWEVVY
jgi:hypothetical protein